MAVIVNIDGASRGNPGDAAIGIVIRDGDKIIKEIGSYIGRTTNNVAEYSSLIMALEEVLFRGLKKAHFLSDSELLVKQLNGEYKVKNEGLQPLHYHVLSLINRMEEFSIKHVTRDKNHHADKLANEALDIHREAGLPLFKQPRTPK